jgi:hypothetical protein
VKWGVSISCRPVTPALSSADRSHLPWVLPTGHTCLEFCRPVTPALSSADRPHPPWVLPTGHTCLEFYRPVTPALSSASGSSKWSNQQLKSVSQEQPYTLYETHQTEIDSLTGCNAYVDRYNNIDCTNTECRRECEDSHNTSFFVVSQPQLK